MILTIEMIDERLKQHNRWREQQAHCLVEKLLAPIIDHEEPEELEKPWSAPPTYKVCLDIESGCDQPATCAGYCHEHAKSRMT